MLTSPEKVEDMKFRQILLEITEIALGWYERTQNKSALEFAHWFGNLSKKAKERIDRGVYPHPLT